MNNDTWTYPLPFALVALLGGIVLLLVLWGLWVWQSKRRRRRPIKMPPRQSGESLRLALAVDVDNSILTMPHERGSGKAHYLIIDTETYDPIESNEEVEEAKPSVPIALSWQILDERGLMIEEESLIIAQRNQAQAMTSEAIEIHGISEEQMLQGLDPSEAYRRFAKVLQYSPLIVAHHLAFHRETLVADMLRYGLDNEAKAIKEQPGLCTMLWGKSLAFKTWQGGEPLYPRLDELFGYLYFGRMHLPLSYQCKTLRDIRLVSACLRYKLKHGL